MGHLAGENLTLIENVHGRMNVMHETVALLRRDLERIEDTTSRQEAYNNSIRAHHFNNHDMNKDMNMKALRSLKRDHVKLRKRYRKVRNELLEKNGAMALLVQQKAQDKAERKGLALEIERLRYELDETERLNKNKVAARNEEEVERRIEEARKKLLKEKEKEYADLEKDYKEYRAKKDAEVGAIQQNLLHSATAARKESEFKELQRERDAHKAAVQSAADARKELEKKLEEAERKCRAHQNDFLSIELQLKAMQARNEEQTNVIKSLQQQVQDGETERRALHNQVMELKGNIRVYCRLRPILKSDRDGEVARNEPLFHGHTAGRGIRVDQPTALVKPASQRQKWSFTFDRFFDENESQTSVFDDVSDMVQSALDGYRVCIFAYGQTGSGKTHTMLGTRDDPGVIPRAMHQIFAHSERLGNDGWDISLKASFLEIYNETVRDLLAPKGVNKDATIKYDVRFDAKARESHVANLTIVDVRSKEEIGRLIAQSMINRATASTKSNDQSSRSHSVFRLRIEGKNKNRDEHFKGLLNLIDLAGSERLKVSGAEGARQKETVHINKSLSALGDVIAALANKDKHVPFRNSKLTYFLQDSLGGDCKTLMFVNLSPVHQSFSESMCSLRFAEKVNACEIGAASKHARIDLRSVA